MSVAGTTLVALGVPFITARFDLRKICAQADENRLDELRDVVDDAGAELRATILAFGDTMTDLRGLAAASEGARVVPAVEHYTQRVKELWSWESRLAIRVGTDDPMHTAFAQSVEALNNRSRTSDSSGRRGASTFNLRRRARSRG